MYAKTKALLQISLWLGCESQCINLLRILKFMKQCCVQFRFSNIIKLGNKFLEKLTKYKSFHLCMNF
jgi:hypothetical protein